jgi:predicted NAD/FAD-dependent oxidoreductase
MFDKGRSPGGRLATRRVETPLGEVRFDHGAQYITAQSPAFARLMEDAALAGAAALWAFDDSTAGPDVPSRSPVRRWIGTPGMSTFARHMAAGLAIETSARVTRIRPDGDGWRLEIERAGQRQSESEGPFDAVVVALPAEQAASLLEPIAPVLAGEAAAARMAPRWAGLFAFDRRIDAPFDVRRFGADEPLTWVARETSKPGRSGPEAWVIHAGSAWSRARLGVTSEQAADALLRAFCALVPDAPPPIWRQAHLWRYAFVETQANSRFAWDPILRLGVCGDWRVGPRVEAAWVSGDSLGAEVRNALNPNVPSLRGT